MNKFRSINYRASDWSEQDLNYVVRISLVWPLRHGETSACHFLCSSSDTNWFVFSFSYGGIFFCSSTCLPVPYKTLLWKQQSKVRLSRQFARMINSPNVVLTLSLPGSFMTVWQQPEAPFMCIQPILWSCTRGNSAFGLRVRVISRHTYSTHTLMGVKGLKWGHSFWVNLDVVKYCTISQV